MESPQEEERTEHGGSDHARTAPRPTAFEVHACRFSSWYDAFRSMDAGTIDENTTAKKTRKNVTMESVVIRPLPADFLEYLRSDGVRLPACAQRVSSCLNDGGGDASSSDEEDGAEPERWSFPALTARVQAALTELGGDRNSGCMPKLNWSSPKDATWINGGSLKCTTAGDVYLLLKSSDFVAFDLDKAWEGLADDDLHRADVCYEPAVDPNHPVEGTPTTSNGDAPLNEDDRHQPCTTTHENNNDHTGYDSSYEIVLRKWCNLHPSMEFRCFVYDHELVAVSQRHPTKSYPHLQPPAEEAITELLSAFFETYVQHRFARGKVHRYVVDLYLDSQERVWIVDFNVWGTRTDGLLFEWTELTALGVRAREHRQAADGGRDRAPPPETRVVTTEMKSMTYDPLSSYRGPADVPDLLNGGAGFEEFMRQCVRPSEME